MGIMKIRDKTYITAQGYVNDLNTEAREIELLECILVEKLKKVEKTLAKLRAYKKRGIVKKVSKYRYEVVRSKNEEA